MISKIRSVWLVAILLPALYHSAHADVYKSVNKLIDSSDWGYSYGYAPSIFYHNNRFHVFFCSQPVPYSGISSLDYVRYAWSDDGRIWSTPIVILKPSSHDNEWSTCDPSVVYYDAGDGPHYYLFYSGNIPFPGADTPMVGTVAFVARSTQAAGPYLKYTQRGTWEVNPNDPKVIVRPAHNVSDGCGSYGAGQQTVVVGNGKLQMWWFDDTDECSNTINNVFFAESDNATDWTTRVKTTLGSGPTGHVISSMDVKFNPMDQSYTMIYIQHPHHELSRLVRRTSTDGVTWSEPDYICDSDCFPAYAHNVGFSGTREGHLISNTALIAFGLAHDAPFSGPCLCWGNWDLHAGVLNPAGNVWNEIPWGWEWVGMHMGHELALGDYDGDGVTDRGIVDRISTIGAWYIIPSTTGAQGTPDIPWGWQWGGFHNAHELVLGDYDGDGATDRGIVDRNIGSWYILSSSGGLGAPGIPWGWQWGGFHNLHQIILGDYDGDGMTDRAIVDRSIGSWYVLSSSGGLGAPGIPWGWQWGGFHSGHELALGDYDGDGVTDRAIVDRSIGGWYILSSSGGLGAPGIPWGWQWGGFHSGHELVLGDYDGDGMTDRAIVDRYTAKWYVIGSTRFEVYAP